MLCSPGNCGSWESENACTIQILNGGEVPLELERVPGSPDNLTFPIPRMESLEVFYWGEGGVGRVGHGMNQNSGSGDSCLVL